MNYFINRFRFYSVITHFVTLIGFGSQLAFADPISSVKFLMPQKVSRSNARMFTSQIDELEQSSESIVKTLGYSPRQPVKVRLFEERFFYKIKGVPSWSSGLFKNKEILLPLMSKLRSRERNEFQLSFRHELTHALIHFASSGRCPAWLDEGLAQMLEGHESKGILRRVRALKRENIRPLETLLMNIDELNESEARDSYAQAYLATIELVNQHGYNAIRKFFELLSQKIPSEEAFQNAFGISLTQFESSLNDEISKRE